MRHPVLFAVSAAVSLFVSGCPSSDEQAEGTSPAEPTPDLSGVVIENDELAASLGKANQIQVDEGKIKQQQARFLDLARRYEARTGKILPPMRLTSDQAALLETMMSKESDVEIKGMLQEILDSHKQIGSLKQEIDDLKGKLPTPTVAKRGDSHMKLAVDFLVASHGLDKKEAEKLAKRTLLTDQLAPGMEVWHFYADGVYASTVTQGKAKVSPYFLNVRAFQKLKTERDEALQLAASLEAEITVLEATRDQLTRELSVVKEEKAVVEDERDALSQENTELITLDESAWYYVDTRRSLREKDILAPIGMKLKDWRKDLFDTRIDLREKQEIRLFAEDFDVERVKKVALLPPGMWTEGRDWHLRIDEEGRNATLVLDDPERFRNEAFIVVLK